MDDGAVGVQDLQHVGAGTLHRVPPNGVGVHFHHGGGQLAAFGSGGPQGKQGGVGLEYHILHIGNGQFFGVLRLADPPAGEGIAGALGSGNVIQLAADSRHGGITLGLVTQVEGNAILILTYHSLSPLGVDGNIRRDGLVAEGIQLGAGGVGVPADEHAAVLGGVGGLSHGLAVHNVDSSNLAAAIDVEADLIGLLLQEPHSLVLVLQDHHAVLFLQRAGAVLVLDEVQGIAAFGSGILTGLI